MLGAAAMGLFAGLMGAKLGARASAGFAKNLRQPCTTTYRPFPSANIDKFSTAGLVTRLTTDVSNLQNAFQMMLRMCVRAPTSMMVAMIMAFIINAGWPACIS
jgi:ATP-binding cassette subfamily B protein